MSSVIVAASFRATSASALLSDVRLLATVFVVLVAAAELGPQLPLIQVLTPRCGSTHTCKMIQRTKTPKRMRYSIIFSHQAIGFLAVISAPCVKGEVR